MERPFSGAVGRCKGARQLTSHARWLKLGHSPASSAFYSGITNPESGRQRDVRSIVHCTTFVNCSSGTKLPRKRCAPRRAFGLRPHLSVACSSVLSHHGRFDMIAAGINMFPPTTQKSARQDDQNSSVCIALLESVTSARGVRFAQSRQRKGQYTTTANGELGLHLVLRELRHRDALTMSAMVVAQWWISSFPARPFIRGANKLRRGQPSLSLPILAGPPLSSSTASVEPLWRVMVLRISVVLSPHMETSAKHRSHSFIRFLLLLYSHHHQDGLC